jgi:hypothetical protein
MKDMQKELLLKVIAETGYNVGYGAKKHLATYDIIEKLPNWVTLISGGAAVFALFVPVLEAKWVSATFIVIAFSAVFILLYDRDKQKYHEVGTELTARFHDLRLLYSEVKSQPADADLSSQVARHAAIQDLALRTNLGKQIFLSDWYAHYKFFWQQQTDWLDEQLKFTLLRDKLPLTFTATVTVALLSALYCFATGRFTLIL